MAKVATTKMSSKGQVVIPEEIRDQLGLAAGVQFVVVGDKDTVMLKVIAPPSLSEFGSLLRRARTTAKKAGLSKSDITQAVKKSRKKR